MKYDHVLANTVLLQQTEDKTAYDVVRLLLPEISLPLLHHASIMLLFTYMNLGYHSKTQQCMWDNEL